MGLSRLELLLGWLAIILACAVVAFVYVTAGNTVALNVAPDTLRSFLLLFAMSRLTLAVGVTLDGVFNLLPGRVLLVLATLTLALVTAQLPLFYIGAVFSTSVILSLSATLLALFRPHRVGSQA
jgi:hypothetical protein